ncbi:hypothetical protein NHQ30_010894 [Ciborinia camelliae]|nr:hypothetical protein NHQ30_010894 [Ciborinia camelliae]
MTQTQWPVVDYIGLVREVSVIAHVHVILALLAHPKDPISIQTHLYKAIMQLRSLISLPQNACRAHMLNPLDFNRPYPDILLLQQYNSFLGSLQSECYSFFQDQNWGALDTVRGLDVYKCDMFEIESVDEESGESEVKRFKEAVLPLVMKSEAEMKKDKWESVTKSWRYMCRELMKGRAGEDMRLLGGGHVAPFMGKGVSEFWAEVEKFWLPGYRGYGGVWQEVAVQERWNGDGMGVAEKAGDTMGFTQTRPIECPCGKCVMALVRVIEKDVESAKNQVNGELKVQEHASTSDCGYQWDF